MNGHSLSVTNLTNDGIAANSGFAYFFMNVTNDSDVVVKNGKIYATKSCMFKLQSGSLRVKNVDIITDNLLLMMTASDNARLEFIADENSTILSKSNGVVRCPDVN